MKEITVILKTGGHCIQSAARNELRIITHSLLYSADESILPVLTEQFELVSYFLKNTDFNKLRASDDRYAGITDAVCILNRGDDGKPVIMFTD